MRKVILGAAISLDGYIARSDGGIDFLSHPKGYSMSELFSTVDVIVFGRKTYEEAVKRGGGSYKSPVNMPTYVFSKSKASVESSGVIFIDQTPAGFVDTMRSERSNGKNIFVMGGGELARSFLRDDVVDELHIGVCPVLLGEGIPFFPSGFSQRDFELVDSKSYQPDGFLELRYSRIRR
jgi:dihydrofolate reductase